MTTKAAAIRTNPSLGWDEIKAHRGDPYNTPEYLAERGALQIGQAVRNLRRWAGLTQDQIAALLGTTQPTVTNWEVGATVPTFDTLRRLAESLGQKAILVFTDQGTVSPLNATIELASLPC